LKSKFIFYSGNDKSLYLRKQIYQLLFDGSIYYHLRQNWKYNPSTIKFGDRFAF